MYLTNEQVNSLFLALHQKYADLHILLDVYTKWGANASKYKNPVNEVGVTTLWGIDDMDSVLTDTDLQVIKEHSLTPDYLVQELTKLEQIFFKIIFSKKIYRKIYRLYELETKKG